MTKQEFKESFVLAKVISHEKYTVDSTKDLAIFDGCALPGFQPVHVTLRSVAKLINWQALQFNGEYDAMALDEVAYIGRKKFNIVG